MKHILKAAAATICLGLPAYAEGDLSTMNIIDVTIELGSNDQGMYIKPSITEFVTGQAYRMIITNVDEFKHEIALNGIGERIFTRKIQVEDADGNLVTEVKGTIREIEVGPGKTVDWYMVPVQTTDEPMEVTCEIPGHYESGMMVNMSIR
jgi:uncharacterized cupredoxin-like copper-binding protein